MPLVKEKTGRIGLREDGFDQNPAGSEGKTRESFDAGAGAGMSSAKIDRMDRIEIIEEIGSIAYWFGQMFGQDSARMTIKKA